MSATNATTNYSFPLFIGTDKPAWLVDWNSAMSAIDAAIKGVDTDVQGAIVDISGLSSTVAAHTSSISTISGQITVITTNLNTAIGNINTINSLIGNGTPTTTDHTIIGAINELHANQGDLADLTTPAASLVDAINAITGGGGAVAASAVSFDPTGTTLVSINVQAAIVELLGKIPANAAALSYDNTGSGLQASNVQDAIDELAQNSTAWASETVSVTVNRSATETLKTFTAGTRPKQAKALVDYGSGLHVWVLLDVEDVSAGTAQASQTYGAESAAYAMTFILQYEISSETLKLNYTGGTSAAASVSVSMIKYI